ncbi:MAG: hypothetical protein L6R41_004659 [Letrouitia leprolyta]|nr:MAG: hypothetical protein L6R41_004659 [Letrouitia leprolyta]
MKDQIIMRTARMEHSSEKRRSSGSEQKNVESKKAQCRNKRMKKLRRHGDIGAMGEKLKDVRKRGINETGVGHCPKLELASCYIPLTNGE